MYISTEVDCNAKIPEETRPVVTRPTLIADIGVRGNYSGLPIRYTGTTLDMTHPVVLASWDLEVICDNTVVVQMDP